METLSTSANAANQEDAALLNRLRSGDQNAYRDFIASQTGMAYAVAYRLLNHDADAADAVQDAFLSFFKNLSSFREGAKLSTWFHRIVINAALMKRRSRKRRQERSIEELLPSFSEDGHQTRLDRAHGFEQADAQHGDTELKEKVRRKIEELPEDYRNVFILRDIEGLDTAETAEVLGESQSNIKTRLHRARQALRSLLEAELSS